MVSGDGASLAFEGTQTWSAGTVVFEGTTGSRRVIEAVNASTTLTLGPGSPSRRLRRHRRQPLLRQLLHVGEQRRPIAADVSGQSLDITSRVTLINNGTITALAGRR